MSSGTVGIIVCVERADVAGASRLFDSLAMWNVEDLRIDVITGPDRLEQALGHAASSEAEASLVVDETCVFIRPFGTSDFISASSIPFAFVTEDNEFWTDAPNSVADEHTTAINTARSLFGVRDPRRLQNRGPVLLAKACLQNLERDFLRPRDWNWRDLQSSVGSAGAWYPAWLQSTAFANVIAREPTFRTLLTQGEICSIKITGSSQADLARAYLGTVSVGCLPYEASPVSSSERLAGVASGRMLVKAIGLRAMLRMPSVQAAMDRLRRRPVLGRDFDD